MRKVYLLLRNNKQNGPYSLEELVQLGLKPYDLVWVEGRSAGWRYPGEIEALKSYVSDSGQPSAPGNDEKTVSPSATQPTAPPRQGNYVAANPAGKHIYVSMPFKMQETRSREDRPMPSDD